MPKKVKKAKSVRKPKPVKKSKKMVVRQTKSIAKRVVTPRPTPPPTAPKEFKRARKFTLKPAIAITDVKDYDARTRLPVLVSEVRDLDETIKEIMAENAEALTEIQAQRGELVEQIKQLVVAAELETVEGDDWRLSYVAGERKTLDKAKLLEKGVSMAIINACTVVTKTKPYVRISALDQTDEEGAEE